MAETTTRTWRHARMAETTTPADRAITQTSGAPFWLLAAILVFGMALGLYVAYQGLSGPGLFTPEQADVAVGYALAATTIVLLLFLTMIAAVFGQVRRLNKAHADTEVRSREETTRQTQVNERMMQEMTALRQREHLLRQELARRRLISSTLSDEDPHVITLEGIGPKYATRLNAIGIITVKQLRAANPHEVASRIDTTPEQVREWQVMAELLEIKGVGPQWAEALARVGVTGRDDLARRDARRLSYDIAQLNRSGNRVTRADPSPATVTRWVRAAGGSGANRRGTRPSAAGVVHAPRTGEVVEEHPY